MPDLVCTLSFSTVRVLLWFLNYLTKRSIVTFGALECLLSRVSHLMKFHQLRVLLYFFKLLDSEKLLPHFLHLNCLSPVWFFHVSSIHQILMSSCQTLCTHSNFFTVGVLLEWGFSKLLDEEKLLSHLVHLNVLSPVWVLSSNYHVTSSHLNVNLFPHFVHKNCFSSV